MFPRNDIPLQKPAEIYWDAKSIPFIVTKSDADAALLLGMVHAHLRLNQMEVIRRIPSGRLSEMLGPLALDVDTSIRTIGLNRAVSDIRKSLPPETVDWLERYTQGINLYAQRVVLRSPEVAFLGLEWEPWSVEDVLSVARLGATDVNWLFWYQLLRLQGDPAFEEFWRRFNVHGRNVPPSFGTDTPVSLSGIMYTSKTGSNTFVVSGDRTKTGKALIGNDPHVGLAVPNLWLVAGFSSPSYHALGVMLPGVPAVLLGRNENIAWGGTNMLGFSSSLYDVSSVASSQRQPRRERIGVRWWFDSDIKIQDTEFGPVITDSPFFSELPLPDLALKWRGHEPSDEISAFLNVAKASNWSEFREAFQSYAVSGQNFLYADVEGNIGQLLALEFFPAAGNTGVKPIGSIMNPDHQWTTRFTSLDLPYAFNPTEGYLVSTNNLPVRTDPPLAAFANSSERYRRISELIEQSEALDLEAAKSIQFDVYSASSHKLAGMLGSVISSIAPNLSPDEAALHSAIAQWDGRYETESSGAAAFQILLAELVPRYYSEKYSSGVASYLENSLVLYDFLLEDAADPNLAAPLRAALSSASVRFRYKPSWGDLHRLRIQHPLGNIPFLGRAFRFGDVPVRGSSTTVMKTAHAITTDRHPARYGTNSRHISDLSDPDENYFVLLGGQDGWFGSENFLDQLTLWQQGKYVRVPFLLDSVRESFSISWKLGASESEQ